jgi:hypothetical protein
VPSSLFAGDAGSVLVDLLAWLAVLVPCFHGVVYLRHHHGDTASGRPPERP